MPFFLYLSIGEDLWFNQANALHGSYLATGWPEVFGEIPYSKVPYHTQYGDRTEIPEDIIQVTIITIICLFS